MRDCIYYIKVLDYGIPFRFAVTFIEAETIP
jgi:hypothetical protein